MYLKRYEKYNTLQRLIILLLASYTTIASPLVQAETVQLKAFADVWLSNATAKERNQSWGASRRFKLKSIQEMAIIRFDSSPIMGEKILAARLFLHPTHSNHRLRYIRTSTVNQDWKEDANWFETRATFNFADHDSRKPWAWPGSQFCDVSFSSGNSLSHWAECRKEADGWVSVEVAPQLITALAVGDTDGLAVMDGGTYNPFNNYIHSRESGALAPYLLVETGPKLEITPQAPVVSAQPDPDRADDKTGAIRLWIQNDASVFFWKIKMNGRLLDRWRVPHPGKGARTEFSVGGLEPLSKIAIEVVGVSPSGHASQPEKVWAQASPALNTQFQFDYLMPPTPSDASELSSTSMRIWAFPALVKLSPLKPHPLHPVMTDTGYRNANAVWNGERATLFGVRGEYVDFQICIEALKGGLKDIRITPEPLHGPEKSEIGIKEIDIFRNWCAQTAEGAWQPAYNIPVNLTQTFSIPEPEQRIQNQTNRTFYIDIYIPKDAMAGVYHGKIRVSARNAPEITIPVNLTVHDAQMPDQLAFWPELNAYHTPANVHAYYRLAHQNRCVANFWVFRPKLRHNGNQIQVLWNAYDKLVGPLLTGEAFRRNRRANYPIECLYLPFIDYWPTALNKETYHYDGHWPKKGESIKHLIDHYLNAPYIGDALSREYKRNFLSVQRQFIEHFNAKGWDQTELQFFFGGKKSHRINYGSNIWWTTDEPYHWGDWLALQFFTRMWSKGVDEIGANKAIWAARADISRPEWQGRVLEGSLDIGYYGGYDNARIYRRCRILKQETGIRVRAYGSAGDHDRGNTDTLALILNAWLNGADGFQIWWALGRPKSLDVQEGVPGNALMVPGDRFGLPVVGDMRLKALRNGEQLIEYLVLLSQKHQLKRRQLKQMVANVFEPHSDALFPNQFKTWQIQGLRSEILKRLRGDE